MAVLIDGSVPLCKEDVEGRIEILGNVFKDDLENIWAKGQQHYTAHCAGNYPSLCADCDEYYTYNF
jgi:sulfatase maturation enzyme AslB (radical SAM superfamily)